MQLNKLVLHNHCQHKHVELDFPIGVIGIFGANGSGKSNTMKAAYANITNDFGRNPGTRAQHIRDGKDADDTSYVYAEWTHGQKFAITRSLDPNENKFQMLDGDLRETANSKEIQKELEQTFQLSKPMLANYVFIQQQQLSAFLNSGASGRADLFSHLCGTAIVSYLYDLLRDQMKDDSRLITQQATEESLALVSEQIKQLKTSVAAKLQLVAKFKKDEVSAEDKKEYKQYIEDYEKLQLYETELTAKRKELTKLKVALIDDLEDVEIRERELGEILALIEEFQEDAEEAKFKLRTVQEIGNRVKDKQDLVRRIGKLKQKTFTKPEIVGGDIDDLSTRYYEALQTLRDKEALYTLVDEGVSKCPTCHTSVDTLVVDAEALASQIAELKELVKNLKTARTKLADFNDSFGKYERELAEHSAKIANLVERLAEMSEVPDEMPDTSKLEKRVDEFNKLIKQKDAHELLFLRADQALASTTTKISVAEADIEKYVKLCKDKSSNTETYRRYLHSLKVSYEATANIKALSTSITDLQNSVDSCKARLSRMNELKAKGSLAQDWVDELEVIRGLFARDMIPKLVHEAYLQQLVEKINENLSDFESPFTILANDGLSLTYRKRRTKERDVDWLSVGEKAILSVAYHTSVSQLFAKDVGLLVMDEPTEGMDTENLKYLEKALERLTQSSKACGRQIIMITHETRLEKVFDKVIRI